MNARFYVSGIGRFASADTIVPDPMNPQSWNRYSYANNNPLGYSDPSGHSPQKEFTHGSSGGLGFALYAASQTSAFDLGLGINGSISINVPIILQFELFLGSELVITEEFESTQFLIVGGNIKLGPSSGFFNDLKEIFDPENARKFKLGATLSPYVAAVYNADDIVADYSGEFITESTTLALLHGGAVGEGYVPDDEGLLPDERTGAYSDTYGYVTGYSWSTDSGRSWYIPIKTHSPVYNPVPTTWHTQEAFEQIQNMLEEWFGLGANN